MDQTQESIVIEKKTRRRIPWMEIALDLAIIVVLLAGTFLRFRGIFWGEYSYLHPDERFMVWVTADIAAVPDIGSYFDTVNSTLNPHNRGHTFYVYGTLPVILTRYISDALFEAPGWEQILQVGRSLSATADLFTVLLVYLIGSRLFNRRAGLLAAAFSAMAVLQIQQSHFFTVDSFAVCFTTLALYFAFRISTALAAGSALRADVTDFWTVVRSDKRSLIDAALFGLAVGLAMASKVNTAVVAAALPAALLIRRFSLAREFRANYDYLIVRNLLAGGLVALLAFRIFQPYAFSGPGFFGIVPNPLWIQNLKDLQAQTSGDVDFPPALQWARRSVTFSFENLSIWGLGIPFALAAWSSFLWMAWRVLKGSWKNSMLLWGWTAGYFIWQSLQSNPTMRYQLPIYPTLAVIAGWGLVQLWDSRHEKQGGSRIWRKWTALVGGGLALVLTAAWALAFVSIYERPVSRVEASRWIYNNVPGPITLQTDAAGAQKQYPLSVPYDYVIRSQQPYITNFTAPKDLELKAVDLPHVVQISPDALAPGKLNLTVFADENRQVRAGSASIEAQLMPAQDPAGVPVTIIFDNPVSLTKNQIYYLSVELQSAGSLTLSDAVALHISTDGGEVMLPVSLLTSQKLESDHPYTAAFVSPVDGMLTAADFAHVLQNTSDLVDGRTLRLTAYASNDQTKPIAETLVGLDRPVDSLNGDAYSLPLDNPLQLKKDQSYAFKIELEGEGGVILRGAAPANETTWDDGLPVRLDGMDAYGGLYQQDLNFEMYWDDNQEKLDRFLSTMYRSDYIFISSNRQWGTTVRVPERYPLTTQFYRSLLGCPAEKDVVWCYRTAEPGMFSEQFGFELVEVFESYPTIGPLVINDQFAEEAFTVYDHPKVFIFKKTASYDQSQVAEILRSVDLTKVVRLTPLKADTYKGNLNLPAEKLVGQQAGGTWAELFDSDSWINAYPALGAAVWYVFILLLGIAVYPTVRLVFRGMTDRGYPFSRLAGLLVFAWLAWMGGSAGIPVTRWMLAGCVGVIAAANAVLAYLQRKQLREEIRRNWKMFLAVEVLALSFFVLDLLIRFGNPDLWHAWKGGEKPMDFSYFNAVLKSTTFPPYDPWFAGGYINYYYYGYVLVGMPVKLLGVVPAIAYNFILPTLFMYVALGAYSLGWNLVAAFVRKNESEQRGFNLGLLSSGIVSALLLLVLGNLGTIRMIWHGFQKLAAPDGVIEGAGFFQRWGWTFEGLGRFMNGAALPYPPGEWYWIPSRVYPGEPITEFPMFTFLYGDLHAHVIALAVTVFAVGWAVSIALGLWRWREENLPAWFTYGITFFVGSLAIGALRPTNTWDYPTFLALACVAILYASLRHGSAPQLGKGNWPSWAVKAALAIGSTALFVGLSLLLYQPYTHWYAQGYNAVDLWKGDRSPFWSFFTHWGLFLFLIISWMGWETRDWLASTPVSALNKLKPFRSLIWSAAASMVLVVGGLLYVGIQIAWVVVPMGVWAAVLLFRQGQSDVKRVVLFITGTALVLILAVELIALRGDIGRMNTVFKLYLQAWTLLAVSGSAALMWLFPIAMEAWTLKQKGIWETILVLLLFSAALFPVMAGSDKIRDRMSAAAPHTLDGMAFMLTSTYATNDTIMDLSEDYRAIRWMQENVHGSPVIVEANTVEYMWGSRFTIYTGLPGVVGWNWHQRQQRGNIVPSEWVTDRIYEISAFYNSTDQNSAVSFLKKYDVKYIIVGQLERANYAPAGLEKFDAFSGVLWNEVYRDGSTIIYETAP